MAIDSRASASGAPQAVIIAGPNGAGKTSAAPELLREAVGIDAFVNADVIAQGLAGFNPESAAFEAGRIILRRLDELAQSRSNFAFESTLSGRSALRFLAELGQVGYHIHICYLWLPAPEMAIARVRRRVELGGHDVPQDVIRRRFLRGLVNFDQSY
ncbi:MAG: Zeta toxin family protein [Dehalococcoidia bacterium]|nr:Zeta toxin family protein [Dehalococcoidia bacterium]